MKRIVKHSLAIIAVMATVPFLTPAGAGERILEIVGLAATQDNKCESNLGAEPKATRGACSGQREMPSQPVFNRPTRFAFPMI